MINLTVISTVKVKVDTVGSKYNTGKMILRLYNHKDLLNNHSYTSCNGVDVSFFWKMLIICNLNGHTQSHSTTVSPL